MVLLLPFLFRCLLFLLIWLLWLGLPVLCWLRDVPVLFPILRKTLLVFAHWVWCWLWVCHICLFICWHVFPLLPLFWEFLSWMGAGFYQMFFCNYWYDYRVFFLHLVYVVYQAYSLADIALTLHPWNKSHLIMVYCPFYF